MSGVRSWMKAGDGRLCPYRLRMGARAHGGGGAGFVDGFLLKRGDGRGVVQPWVALGQPSCEVLLGEWDAGVLRSGLWRGAFAATEVDRRGGWEAEVPRSHYTWHSFWSADENLLWARRWGCDRLKVKAGPGFARRERLLLERLAGEGWEVAVDYNQSLGVGGVEEELVELRLRLGEGLVWVEDPVAYEGSVWRRLKVATGVRLALDQGLRVDAEEADIFVIKPALEDWRLFVGAGKGLVVTSNMDHPVGQWFAAYEAAEAGGEVRLFGAGLLTHHLYEEPALFEGFCVEGGRLVLPVGGVWDGDGGGISRRRRGG